MVASRAEAWIGTPNGVAACPVSPVASRAEAWIGTFDSEQECATYEVASRAEAWIGTFKCVDRKSIYRSPLVRRRGLEPSIGEACGHETCRLSCGGVDWNSQLEAFPDGAHGRLSCGG